jgi:DNA polymerase III alpha subunit (gram-positive type)
MDINGVKKEDSYKFKVLSVDSLCLILRIFVHSQYSMLDGAIKIKDLCKKAKEYGMTSVAITDNHNMHGQLSLLRS